MIAKNYKKILFVVIALITLFPVVGSGVALLLGFAFSMALGNPFASQTRAYTSKFLAWSIIGLGAGMNLHQVLQVGSEGVGYTFFTITMAMCLGMALGKIFNTPRDTSVLLSVGTAICGGSAIAAATPVMGAKEQDVSISLAIVFMLNAVALYLFPIIGHLLGLTQAEFGLWSALAIHDTSSVVGAGMTYGAEALKVGTTVKLARTLWIIPLTFVLSFFYRQRLHENGGAPVKKKRPWFILGFLSMAFIVTYIPELRPYGEMLASLSRRLLVLTLFLIGANLSFNHLKQVGFKALLHAILLWVIMAVLSLAILKL